ncbi:MAG: TIGR03905 family TSCPD domain-containing protein [Eubacteriaceae bacterium]|nr:TIGR03905 family TSCPD domain-containing protein [Eubacteriaceae bacterium]
MRFKYTTSGVCSKEIYFDLEEGKVRNIEFIGGCNGNLKALAVLLEGFTPAMIAEKLKGNTCGVKKTSCADQLARAVLTAQKQAE